MVFNLKNKFNLEIMAPDLTLDEIFNEFPKDIPYCSGDNSYVIISDSEKIELHDFFLDISESFLDTLNGSRDPEHIFRLSYNAQVPVTLLPTQKSYITLNDQEVSFDDLHNHVFSRIKINSRMVAVYPPPFPEPIDIFVSTADRCYSRILKIHRAPDWSIDRICFKSEDKNPFHLQIISSKHVPGVSLILNLRLNFASSINDIVESVFIYNDFVDGKAYINNHSFSCYHLPDALKKFDIKSANFWEKVLQIEKILNTKFENDPGSVDSHVIHDVEFLCRNLVCNVPIRINEWIESVTGNYHFKYEEQLEKAKEGLLYFQYRITYEFHLFGTELKLPAICVLFNIAVGEIINKEDGNVQLKLKQNNSSESAYTSVLCFKDEEDLHLFLKKAGGNASAFLRGAETIEAYLA